MRRLLVGWIFATGAALLAWGCFRPSPLSGAEVANQWADLSLDITRTTPGNSPTYASRCFGYLGVTMYESVVHADSSRLSLAGQLSGLPVLPRPDPGVAYVWPMVLSSGQAAILRFLYNHTSDANKQRIDSLENATAATFASSHPESAISVSQAYGRAVAAAIANWSTSDGGHRAYLRNFEKELAHPDRPGSWEPPLYAQSFSHHPLHPRWGTNRPFVPANYGMDAPEVIPYDTTVGSPYFRQFLAVYEKERSLTRSEKEAALWWGDDPDVTFTPPGHSYYLAGVLLRQEGADMLACAETYARTGMAVADAFINCWKWKYTFFTERPNTFIPRFIDPEWESFWPDPPFPSFPSGHAIQAAAATTVLIDLHGDERVLEDKSHFGRAPDRLRNVGFTVRKFDRLSDLAREVADSRFYGGIHTPQDNDRGLEKGAEIGENVNRLRWRKS